MRLFIIQHKKRRARAKLVPFIIYCNRVYFVGLSSASYTFESHFAFTSAFVGLSAFFDANYTAAEDNEWHFEAVPTVELIDGNISAYLPHL
jgi:hypothetical protein